MNAIFRYWHGKVLPGTEAGTAAMRAYAHRIGADYIEHRHDPYMQRHGVEARWFDKLRPVFDPDFAHYDKVLVPDHDVFPVDGLSQSIFDEPVGHFGMCEEPDQPEFRERFPSSLFSLAADRRWSEFVLRWWGCRVPLDDKGRPRTWNAGVILLTRAGMDRLRTIDPSPAKYVYAAKRTGLPAGYCTEQGYLNTIAFLPGVEFTQLSVEWNRMLHHLKDGSTYDRRTPETKFVHVMFRAADHNDAAWHHQKVNEHLQR